MTFQCKTFPNENAANGAINAAEATWVRPSYTDVGAGRHVPHASLPPQRLSEPVELVNARWAVVADHPGFKGEFIVGPDVKGPPEFVPLIAQAKGAESGVVERPAAKSKKRTA